MHATTPFFFGYTPARLPIGEAICTIVRVCRGWRLRRLATNVVNPAAPLLFGSVPSEILTNRAIVWIDRPCWGWGWQHDWTGRNGRRRRSSCGWRCGRRRRWRRRRRGHNGCRQHDWRRWGRRLCRRRTASSNCHTTVVFLCLGPHVLHHPIAPHAPWHLQAHSRTAEWSSFRSATREAGE